MVIEFNVGQRSQNDDKTWEMIDICWEMNDILLQMIDKTWEMIDKQREMIDINTASGSRLKTALS